jgi:hypothetical protein
MFSDSGGGMPRGLHQFGTALVVCALMSIGFAAYAAEPEHADVRVLIDISGSMRQNDPQNLRRPALRMLAGLLQPGTRAGVWTFARWSNNLVPVGDVDAAWKQRVQALSGEIASPGQFTHIEEVLRQASADWRGQPATHNRHLVLLTDGMVDVSRDEAESAASRARILDDVMPGLQRDGVRLHTIALSERADHELLRRLAEQTGGWYQQVAVADELQRVFLRMFEQVSAPDSVPLTGNRFIVDSSVEEATVLLFTKDDAKPVVLQAPDGERYTDTDLPAGIAWFRDQGYHLITISAPRKGEWSLEADIDPDNRVMIVTDLKLRTSAVPAYLAVGEELHIEAYLSARGERVTREAFLRLLDVRADAFGPIGRDPQPINDTGKDGDTTAGDGRYGFAYSESTAARQVELLIAIDSATFMREKRFRLAVHEPVEAAVNEGPTGAVLSVDLQPAVLQDGAEVVAWQEGVDGERMPLALEALHEGQYEYAFDAPPGPVYVEVAAMSRLGNRVERRLGPLGPPGFEPPPLAPPESPSPAAVTAEESPSPEPASGPETVPPPELPAEPPAEPPVDDAGGWALPAALFGGFNLLLLAGGGAWWFLRRRRRSPPADDLTLDDGDADVDLGRPA